MGNSITKMIINKKKLYLCVALSFMTLNFIIYQILKIEEQKMIFRILSLFFSFFPLTLNLNINKKVVGFLIVLCFLLFESMEGIAIVYAFLMCFFMRNKREADIIGACNVANIVAALAYIIFYFLDLTNMVITTYAGRTRNDLGFNNINTGAAFLLSISLILVLSKNNYKIWLISMVIIIAMYRLTNSRTPMVIFLSFVLFMLLFVLVKNRRKQLEIYKIMSYLFVILCFIFPFISGFLIHKFPVLNTLSTYRLSNYYNRLSSSTMKSVLLGGRVDWFIDNSVLCMFFLFGIVGVILFFICSVWALFNLWEDKKYEYISFMLAITLGGCLEGYLFSPEILYVFLFWFILFKYSVFYVKDKKINIRKKK